MFSMHKIQFKPNFMNFHDCLHTFGGHCIYKIPAQFFRFLLYFMKQDMISIIISGISDLFTLKTIYYMIYFTLYQLLCRNNQYFDIASTESFHIQTLFT